MTRKIIIFLSIIVLIKINLIAAVITFDKVYGGTGYDTATSIQQKKNGGYIVAGNTYSKGAGESDIWVLNLDIRGNILWEKTFGGEVDDKAACVRQTADGGFIVGGSTLSKGKGGQDFWVLKLDQLGNLVWDSVFGRSGGDECMSLQETGDGNYILTGSTDSVGSTWRDIWLVKLDKKGKMIWEKIYGGKGGDEGNFVYQTRDGGYIIAGGTQSKGAGSFDYWIIKVNQTGDMIWDKIYGGRHTDSAQAVIQTPDSGYLITGYNDSKGAGSRDAWIIKLGSDGTQEWEKTYGGIDADDLSTISPTSDNGYILTGSTLSKGAGRADLWIMKIDQAGNIIWDEVYGGISEDAGYAVQETEDKGFIVCGSTESKGSGAGDLWILKLDQRGKLK